MVGVIHLRQWIDILRQHKQIIDIHVEVDPCLELAEIHRRIAEEEGPALFFHRVKGSTFPVVTNLFGSMERVQLAFPQRLENWIEQILHLLTGGPPSLGRFWQKRSLFKRFLHLGTKRSWRSAPVMECCDTPPDLEQMPLLQLWPHDGGHFITLPLVYTEPLGGGVPNLGMYRIQRYDKTTTGIHWQIGKGGGFHYHQAEMKNKSLPVHIFLGGPPSLILSAITPLPENVTEIMLAGLLQEQKLSVSRHGYNDYPLFSECEFALVGEVRPHERRMEGPFGDHYGYYSLAHPFPVFHCKALYHRRDAIYPATVVGKPRQEDFYLGNYLQKLLSPIFPIVMPGVKDLWSYGETGFHSLAAAVVRERYYRESMSHAFRILGEGQLSLTKFLLLTDQAVDLQNFTLVLKTILERFRPEKDLFIFSNLSLDTLDYTGPELNKGSRGIMLGCGEPIRTLPEQYHASTPLPSCVTKAAPFCAGCLMIEVALHEATEEALKYIAAASALQSWPLVIIVDEIQPLLNNEALFLWTVFTRFEPAADIYSGDVQVYRHHLCYEGPILIDARMKASYPAEVCCDFETQKLVDRNWDRYFK